MRFPEFKHGDQERRIAINPLQVQSVEQTVRPEYQGGGEGDALIYLDGNDDYVRVRESFHETQHKLAEWVEWHAGVRRG